MMGPVSRNPVLLAGWRQLTDPVSRDPACDAELLIARRWHCLAQTVELHVVVSVLVSHCARRWHWQAQTVELHVVVSVLVVSVLVSQHCYQPPRLVRHPH